jgi:ankyrin repeat protein
MHRFTKLLFISLGLLSYQLLPAQSGDTKPPVTNSSTESANTSEVPSLTEEEETATPGKDLSFSERTRLIFNAIESGDIDMADTLANSSVYYRHNEEGETALTQAIVNSDVDMVRMLTKRAVINLKNQKGETPLTLAIKQGNTEIIALVMHRAKAALKNDMDETPLWLAIDHGDLFIAQKLIEKGARINHKSRGETAVFQAVRTGQLNMLALLIKNGANPSLANEEGFIPLQVAVTQQKINMAKVLLNRSMQPFEDANWKNAIGEPLLVQAVENNDYEMVRLLLVHGAQTNYANHMDNTPLHLAADLGYKRIASLLLEHGADPASTNMLGETAREMAESKGHNDLLDIFSMTEKGTTSSFAASYEKR